MERIGRWSFLAGVLLSILLGFVAIKTATVYLVLVGLGLVVGFLNITEKETVPFLVAAIALMMAGTARLEVLPLVGELLQTIVRAINIFVAPAAIVVALKTVKDLAGTSD